MYLETIADLLALPFPIPPNTEFIVGGFYKAGDGGGGTFIWVLNNVIPHDLDEDGGIVFYSLDPFNDPLGYFQRVFSGPINVRWFGAIYDSVLRPDVTSYVHDARDSQAFADNGTLYFPKGVYPGAFVFNYGSTAYDGNEINIIGDGQGSVLQSNGGAAPILNLGYKLPTWRWAKVANLKIDGLGYGWDGVRLDSAGSTAEEREAGRWIFEQVLFMNCARAVDKPAGNIGNHFIDCTWRDNSIGVFAQGFRVVIGDDTIMMHSGCDRYTGGHFDRHSTGCIYYEDVNPGGGQIILDGTIIEGNPGFGIKIKYTGGARMSQCAISIRNVYFESNIQGDIHFLGVRSVRIDDCTFFKLAVRESSVNLYNCSHQTGGYPDPTILVDSKSSLVAYEHRYFMAPGDKIFVHSISYDATPELGDWRNNNGPAPWIGTSVWGPLRAVTVKPLGPVAMSDHLDWGAIAWFEYIPTPPFTTTIPYTTSGVSYPRVLGSGSCVLSMGANKGIWNDHTTAYLRGGKYTVWSIHTYTEDSVEGGELYGEIISQDRSNFLGHVYFRQNQWACSYGMKFVADDQTIILAFHTLTNAKTFYVTDYQIVQFDDLASANAFVNSREYVSYKQED